MEELLEIQMFLYVQGTKEGDIACGLSTIVTGIYLYVRDKYFYVYVNGRKAKRREGRQEIILVD